MLTFDTDRVDPAAIPPVELADLATPFLSKLVGMLSEQGVAVHARPVVQPQQVHELTSQLFNAYQIENGSVHLAGCRLEEVPFLRRTGLLHT
ncbi:MAG: hypothetical protein KDA42_10535, partial [Planctomycetales bacterium]|nr:hypothetical protein [Planctomycetales bacterium]